MIDDLKLTNGCPYCGRAAEPLAGQPQTNEWLCRPCGVVFYTTDECGASLLEYTVLIGLITVAVMSAITFISAWINSQWSSLKDVLP